MLILTGAALAYDGPQAPHTDYTPRYIAGCGGGVACHTVFAVNYLTHNLDTGQSTDYTNFCLSCHNVAGEAHERSVGSASTNAYVNITGLLIPGVYDGDSHSWNGVKGGAGTRTPTLFGGTAHMPGGNRITCQVCHQGMGKSREENLDWRFTTTSDNKNYVIDDGQGSPMASTKQYLAQYIRVYRSTGLIGRPEDSRPKKDYLVDPSEYTYDYSTATVTFAADQSPTDYIYVDIGQPYFRDGNAANAMCIDCHYDRTDSVVSHAPGTGVKDHHPSSVLFGFYSGLADTLKVSADGNIYIEGNMVLCTSCHDPHNAASDDGQLTRSADSSELCTDCHKTNGFDGYSTESTAVANHNGKKHSAGAPTECLDCHTTHNTDNILLIKNTINGVAVNFQNFSGAQSFGNEAGDSVCEACHTSTKYHRNDPDYNASNTHKSGNNCTKCHKHATGFGGGGCTGCHGYPPANTGELVSEPASTGSSTEGKHITHASVKGYGCEVCHKGGMTVEGEENYVIELGFSFNGYTSGTYDGQTLINGYSYSAPNTSGGTMSCSGVYCHGGTMEPNGGADTSPAWNGSVSCGDCHGADSINPPTKGSHAKHAGGAAGQMAYDCTLCHSGYPSSHVNTLSEVSFSASDSRTQFGEYTGTTQMLDAYGNCRNLYCHSDGTSAGQPFMGGKNPTWGGSVLCGDCHAGDQAHGQGFSTMSSGSHTRHVTELGYNCTDCHNGAGTGTSRHANRVVNISVSKTLGTQPITGSFIGMTTAGSAYGRCDGVYCHSNADPLGGANNYSTIKWGGSTSCTSCHGYSGSSATMSPLHPTHIDTYSFTCDNCHTGNSHVSGTKDVSFSGINSGGSYSSPDCSGIYCHSSGARLSGPFDSVTTASNMFQTWTTTVGSLGCNGCHGDGVRTDGMPSYANGDYKENSHVRHVVDSGYGCEKCHRLTTSDGSTITTASLHTNAAYNVDIDTSVGGGYTGTPAGSCDNTKCHGTSSPAWGGSTTCSSCHTNQGAGTDAASYNGSHSMHAGTYGFACESCHTKMSSAHTNTSHANLTGRGEVLYTDKGLGNWSSITYGGGATTFSYRSMYDSPYTGAVSPSAYVYGSVSTADASNASITWSEGSCGTVWCHSNADPLDASVSYASPTWGQGVDCRSCHGGEGATGAMSTRHAKHVDTYGFGCSKCHNATVNTNNTTITTVSNHVNGVKNVAFDTTNGSGNYDTPPTCASLYCHGDGVSNGSASWNGADTTCASCHNYTAGSGSAMSSGKHGQHINGGNLGRFECSDCHTRTVAANNTTINYALGKHVDESKTVALSSFNGYTGFYTASFTCRNTYCHSSGQSTPTPRVTPDWTAAPGLDCGGCHGADGFYSLALGAPDYENISTADRNSFNGHYVGAHVSTTADCVKCHDATVDSVQNILATGNHINGTREVSFALGGSYANKRCSNTDTGCHGTSVMRWGGQGGCIDCHKTTGVETDDYNYGTAPRATINFYEWTSVGHGKKGTYRYTGNPGANKACEDCHGSEHGFPTNPFRLMSSTVIKPSDPNTLCLQSGCHDTGIGNHDYAHVAQGSWSWTPKCVDCHDPHGDSGGVTSSEYNGAMVQREVSYGASNAYGVPNLATIEAVDFPANYARAKGLNLFNWSSFVVDTGQTNKGVCRVCHADAGTNYFTRTTYSTHKFGQGACISCHVHSEGFKPSCDSCHGYPPSTTDNKNDNIGAVGAHDQHVAGIGLNCYACHKGNSHNQAAVSAPYTSLVTPTFVNMSVSSEYNFAGNQPTYNGTPGSWSPNKTCGNVGCHYGDSLDWDCQP